MNEPKMTAHDFDDEGLCLMTLVEFKAGCESNGFTDDDGHGNYATGGEVSDVRVYPTDVVTPEWKAPTWATHVVWYNK